MSGTHGISIAVICSRMRPVRWVATMLGAAALWGYGAVDVGAAVTLSLRRSAATVKRFSIIEFTINADRQYANPFDTNEVDMWLEIAAPNGATCRLPAFYDQPFERAVRRHGGRDEDWVYPIGQPGWRVRFTPAKTGEYVCVAHLRDGWDEIQSEPVKFSCTPGEARGFVHVSQQAPRFFATDDGKPFIPIGHNLAFLFYGQKLRTVDDFDRTLGKLAANGGNFARVWAGCGDWALAVEWRKSLWGRTWESGARIVEMPGQPGQLWDAKAVEVTGDAGATLPCRPCAPVAVRPQTRYRLSALVRTKGSAGLEVRARDMVLGRAAPAPKGKRYRWEFTTRADQWWLDGVQLRLTGAGTAWVAHLSLREPDGGPELLWEADLDRPVMGEYNLRDCFLLDEALRCAQRRGIYLQLCLLSNPTRDLYMARLQSPDSPEYRRAVQFAKRVFRYAVARWGCFTSLAAWEFFNEMNPGLPTDPFYRQVGEYLDAIDIYHHPRTTSAWHPNPRDWQHPSLQIANHHFYVRPDRPNEPWQDEVAMTLTEAERLLSATPAGRPAMLAECGLASGDWGRSPAMKSDAALNHFHNMVWASALTGLAGPGMFWWWESLDEQNAYVHYRPLSKFLAQVPWLDKGLQSVRPQCSDPRVRAVGLQTATAAFIWLFNADAAWHRVLVEKNSVRMVPKCTVTLTDLRPGAYQAAWFDTRAGVWTRAGSVSTAANSLRITAPSFEMDIACWLSRASAR